MELLPGEKILLESDNGSLVLTTHRVRYEKNVSGLAHTISIMLDQIASCEMRATSHPELLIFAAFSFVGGIVLGMSSAPYSEAGPVLTVGGIGLAVALAVLYLCSKTQSIALSSAAASIQLYTTGMSIGEARNFIDKVEEAKNHRQLAQYNWN